MHRYRRPAHRRHLPYSSQSRYAHYVAPNAVGTRVITKTPSLRKAPGSSFTVSNRELCFPVIAQTGSDQYSVVAFPVQPGLQSVFPLLSNTAKTFVRYKMRYCIDFVPNVGTSTPGTIFIANDINCNESPPGNPSQLMTYVGAVSANIWSQTSFPTNRKMCKANDKKLFVRYGSLQPNEDIKLYDSANIFVALSGLDLTTATPAGSVIGQLYINYSCTFYDQRLEPVIQSNVFSYYSAIDLADFSTPIAPNSETQLSYVFGSGDVQYSGDIAWDGSPSNRTPGITLVFPSIGFYLILQNMEFTVTPIASPTWSNNDIAAPQPIGSGDTPSNIGLMYGSAGTSVLISDALSIESNFSATSSTSQASQCLQVVQVLESGTYFSGTDVVVGNAWISKSIGTSSYSGGANVQNTNEELIYNYSAAASSSTIIFNTSIEVTQIDAATADYYFPGYFSIQNLSALKARSLAQHQRQAPIRGIRIGGSGRKFKVPLPIMSTSKAIIDLSDSDSEPEQEQLNLKHLSDKEYREHMERLFDARKK